ncbi:MAG TPA: Rieske 2Fe-2S domain-containing protein [Acidimicrobiales bacterium]|nr:Rieske 2Fe-2S domain-containing protein [Acidimicrobiales bacterium]
MIVLQPTEHDNLWATTGAAGRPAAGPLVSRWGRHGPPPMAASMAGWALIVLRGFLGVTFTFAGLQKLANPGFFHASNPASIQAQLAAAARISPIRGLVVHLEHAAVPIGVLIAVAELAVGVATVAGFWSRVAAVGGMLLSLSLFLTVSFHSSPYYTGSDIVFLFAWTPLLIAGSGGVLSVDALLRDRERAGAGAGLDAVVPVSFDLVQRVCGSYHAGSCRAMQGAACRPAPCPYLAGASRVARAGPPDAGRRRVTLQGIGAAAVAGVAVVLGGVVAGVGRAIGATSTVPSAPPLGAGTTSATAAPTTTPGGTGGASTTSEPRPAGTPIGAASTVPVGGAATFTDPGTGDPSLVVQPREGTFAAFDAVCPHEGCIVGYSQAQSRFVCPCHGSQFNGRTGAVIHGPAPHGLTRIRVQEGPDGQLYVT